MVILSVGTSLWPFGYNKSGHYTKKDPIMRQGQFPSQFLTFKFEQGFITESTKSLSIFSSPN